MRLEFRLAETKDVSELVSLRMAANERLTAQFGKGVWSGRVTEKGVLFGMRRSKVYVAVDRDKIVGALSLSTRKPWAIDKSYFSASEAPLYLTDMVVDPLRQRKGIGRRCIEEAKRVARGWPSDALRLDAFDAEAGAGEFYGKCGFDEVGRVVYKGTPLIYFEMLL